MRANSIEDNVYLQKYGLNYRTCLYMMDNGSWCGSMAVRKIEMPEGVPDMPVCRTHAEALGAWTVDMVQDILDEMIAEEADGA